MWIWCLPYFITHHLNDKCHHEKLTMPWAILHMAGLEERDKGPLGTQLAPDSKLHSCPLPTHNRGEMKTFRDSTLITDWFASLLQCLVPFCLWKPYSQPFHPLEHICQRGELSMKDIKERIPTTGPILPLDRVLNLCHPRTQPSFFAQNIDSLPWSTGYGPTP